MTDITESGARVMERTVADATPGDVVRPEGAAVEEFFDVARTAAALADHKYRRAALQFPDALLPDAPAVVMALTDALSSSDGGGDDGGCQLFVLGDTSAGACCVDEVAAQHIDADVVVHYGRSCLSPTSRLPVVYVFGKGAVDAGACAKAVSDVVAGDEDIETDGGGLTVVLLCDNVYHHCVASMSAALSDSLSVPPSAVVVPDLPLFAPPIGCGMSSSASGPAAGAGGDAAAATAGSAPPPPDAFPPPSTTPSSTTIVGGQPVPLPDGVSMTDNVIIVYVGGESPRLTNILMEFPSTPCVSFNPVSGTARREGSTVNRSLRQRFALIQRAKTASVVGIVMGTLGVARFRDVLASLRALVRSAGLQSYTFVVGKVNVAKLANFAEIDVFVLVACPESSLINSREFYKPVITPYELGIALNPDVSWEGRHATDFRDVLPVLGNVEDGLEAVEVEGKDGGDGDSDSDGDAPFFSPVTGGFVSRPSRSTGKSSGGGGDAPDAGAASEGALMAQGETALAVHQQGAAAEIFAQREYQGLEPRIGETPAADITDGMIGIAAEYRPMGEATTGGDADADGAAASEKK